MYAYDADDPAQSTPLWSVTLGPSVPISVLNITDDLANEVDITSTPVIDLTTSTIYIVAHTYENGVVRFRLNALDIGTGSHRPGSPVVIQGSVPGTAPDSVGGVLAFNPWMQLQRPGLLLLDGQVYIGFGSHNDLEPYHGWVFGYDAATLEQTAVQCLSPDGLGAGVWQGGVGLAADSAGNIYVQTGHSSVYRPGVSYSNSLVKLSTDQQPRDRRLLHPRQSERARSGGYRLRGQWSDSDSGNLAQRRRRKGRPDLSERHEQPRRVPPGQSSGSGVAGHLQLDYRSRRPLREERVLQLDALPVGPIRQAEGIRFPGIEFQHHAGLREHVHRAGWLRERARLVDLGERHHSRHGDYLGRVFLDGRLQRRSVPRSAVRVRCVGFEPRAVEQRPESSTGLLRQLGEMVSSHHRERQGVSRVV